MKSSKQKVIFATSSERRVALSGNLQCVRCGLVAACFVVPDVDEVYTGTAIEIASANAKLKGEWGVKHYPEFPVLAFDTVVEVDDKVFGKPKNGEEAKYMLATLCGRVHDVYTAVFFGYNDKRSLEYEKSTVVFGEYNESLINEYIKNFGSVGKAGGYNIQDDGVKRLIKEVQGNVDNVAGLPLGLTDRIIKENLF